MKQVLLSLCLLLSCSFAFAQNNEGYVVEEDGSLSFLKVIECKTEKSKEELFILVQNYFSYNYNDGKSVIQTTNNEQFFIIGSGLYSEYSTQTDSAFGRTLKFSTPHVIRIDCKDGRIRVIITVSQYSIRDSNWTTDRDVKNYSRPIRYEYPLVEQRKPNRLTAEERRFEAVFNRLKEKINNQFDSIEKTINSGNSILENADW